MKQYLISAISMLLMMPVYAQFTQKVHHGNTQDAGITYTLPKTSLKINVEAQCTTVKAGPLAQFAEKYLGISNAPQADEVNWQITAITVNPFAEADTAKTFHVNTSGNPVPSIRLSETGILVSINCETQVDSDEEPAAVAEAEETAKLHAVNVMNEEMLRAGSKNKQAEIAARQIFRIRESRLNLLTGEVDNLPADGASFQLVLNNLEAQEKAYLELFLGVTSVTTDSRVYTYEPQTDASDILFRFSRHFGFVDSDDLVGEAYMMELHVLEDNTKVPVLVDNKGRVRPSATGIAYNVPGKASYAVSCRSKQLATGTITVAQLGHIERLSQTQFTDKKNPAKATFDPLTGNIKFYE